MRHLLTLPLTVVVWLRLTGTALVAAEAAPTPQTSVFTVQQKVTELRVDAEGEGRPVIVWEDISANGVPVDPVLYTFRTKGR